ncbi:conserved Plasmodium protein, unknown function [Plasmodium knowlesi strain H]|uniref:Uncharacterized protein n=3 Tax=Plasmodium knowlesi TaxID=5850 RepID=A0A1A7W3P3_PLAKH|nr:conserved Plasmodium protein, unknown function [Plasmodium knowlesi strain H]OTN66023.1 Uncharacterized protein PKNOH_S100051500 [Plasmodium knowlesi]CAA9987873.1 conserved Plasmodium protein, unknown function [Plasmodium knowlesi strain H]SBO22287.1 conserved Plasmodium protein, unknown function [Plasmodium knowlesi strain H]SBO28806.1 conserved Plasmodium protein, unknown function [Plasmodium knowlesi strain H]VVS77347.1 conserved Plasmodium protein, unknown function [Plasmodium knowlesi 
MKGNYDSFSRENSDDEQCKNKTHSQKKKMMIKYMSTIEEGMKEEEVNSLDEVKLDDHLSDEVENEVQEGSYVDSEDHIILTDEDVAISGNTGGDSSNNESPCDKDDDYSMDDIDAGSASRNHLSSGPASLSFVEPRGEEALAGLNEGEGENALPHGGSDKDAYQSSEDDRDTLPTEGVGHETGESADNSRGNRHKSCDEGDEAPGDTKDNVTNIEQMHTNEKKNALFDMEIKDINDWKSKYRHLTSSFRKLEKEMNRAINSEHIDQITRRSIKQHKDFLDNEYKEWLSVLVKTVSEFKKNIGAHVSELNEKEYQILSKNIFEDFREKYLEETNLNIVLYLAVTKHDITVDDDVAKYLQGCYESANTDKTLYSNVQKLLEVNEHIRNIGGRTGTWDEDEHNYFMKVYENNANLGDEVLLGMLKSCMNKSEEEIIEHVSWYKQFISYKHLKNRCLNNISIINVNEQRKNDSKIEEKKNMIQKWKEKKQQESAIKMKEMKEMKKEEMKINKMIRENIKKKKQMIQEQLNNKKEEIKKNKMEKQQKSVLSEESLQRINERNERILQKKVQSNLNLSEDINEREKKTTKQKYMHIQSKLLSNTDNLLRRIESSVETIKNIL